MKAIQKIKHVNQLIAIIIPKGFSKSRNGIEFFTHKSLSQQLGYMRRPAGYKIRPHTHKFVLRRVMLTQETLWVKSGCIRLDLYLDNKKYFTSRTLSAGDIIFLAAGGHAIQFLKPSEIIEIKQGPYLSRRVDKTHFASL